MPTGSAWSHVSCRAVAVFPNPRETGTIVPLPTQPQLTLSISYFRIFSVRLRVMKFAEPSSPLSQRSRATTLPRARADLALLGREVAGEAAAVGDVGEADQHRVLGGLEAQPHRALAELDDRPLAALDRRPCAPRWTVLGETLRRGGPTAGAADAVTRSTTATASGMTASLRMGRHLTADAPHREMNQTGSADH